MFEVKRNIKTPVIIATIIIVCFTAVFVYNIRSRNNNEVSQPWFDKKYLKPVNLIKAPNRKGGIKDPVIYANNVVLLDVMSMYPLYEKNERQEVSIASMTKLMTALVVLDHYKLSDVIEVKQDAVTVIGSKIGLKEGEKITGEKLLNGLLISSGNDAAIALSSYKQESSKFVELMNRKAKDIGMSQTKFMDPAGLNDDGKSTAYDIAILFGEALKKPEVVKVVSTSEETISSVDGSNTHELKNSNRLVTDEMKYDGIIGGKTGFTPDAGHSLVSAANIDGRTIVAVVINTIDISKSASAVESKKLYDWCKNSFIFGQ